MEKAVQALQKLQYRRWVQGLERHSWQRHYDKYDTHDQKYGVHILSLFPSARNCRQTKEKMCRFHIRQIEPKQGN